MAYTLISSADGSGVSDIVINSIPQTYKSLILDIRYRTSNDNGVAIRFNNDISTYNSSVSHTWGGGRYLGSNSSTILPFIANNIWVRTIVKIPDYTSSARHGFSSQSWTSNTNGGMHSGSWDGGAGISRIDFSPFNNTDFTFSYELWGLS